EGEGHVDVLVEVAVDDVAGGVGAEAGGFEDADDGDHDGGHAAGADLDDLAEGVGVGEELLCGHGAHDADVLAVLEVDGVEVAPALEGEVHDGEEVGGGADDVGASADVAADDL